MAMAQEAYLESEVAGADGLGLVRILYRAALESVDRARRHLRQGEILPRSRQISRAMAVLSELALSLDHQAGTPLSRNLAELYDYMQRRLTEAHTQQTDAPLAEVSRLLAKLLEAWLNCRPVAPTMPPPQPAAFEYAPQSWSL